MKLDSLDLEILKHMQDNARVSLRELGRKLEKPHTTIFSRVNRLQENGLIQKFSAVIHPKDVGLKVGLLFIDSPPSQSRDLAQQIAKLEEVSHVYRTFDGKIIAKALVPDLEGHKGLEEFLAKIDHQNMQVYPIDEILKHESTIHDDALDRLNKEKQ
ncbi:MAG: winged helix-turn-helix transcriptional regulator [Candidatus Altiarchaeales archaeon]|nr:winged helix-turn-helix transcriptional regulator [Candidatus Altiarchaeales archaeon]